MKKVIYAILFNMLFFASSLCAAEVQQITSPSGIKAWLVEDKSLPIISITFLWRGGVEKDGEDKQGLSHMAATLLTKGAGADDADAFEKKLQENAILLGFDARRDALVGRLRSLKETLPTARDLLKASLKAPRFDEKAIVLMKSQIAGARNNYKADPDWLASRLMIASLFEDHPYFLRTLGTEKTVATITRKDLQNWTKRLTKDGLLVSVSGDISAEECGALLDAVFSGLPAAQEAKDIENVSLKNAGQKINLTFDGPQTNLSVVWQGLPKNDKDRFALEVMNYIFGGGSFSSRLMKEIRDKRGLTYGISSSQETYDKASFYVVEASMQNEKAGEVLKLVEEEVAKITSTLVSEDELQAAKDYLIGAYALSLTSTQKVAGYYLDLQRLSRTPDEQAIRAKAIGALTREDVLAVAKRILSQEKTVLAVGRPVGISFTKTLYKID